ncbi:MAG TPA: dihydrodipicolinate synthase family protein [Pirellulales bacterium]|nr:dihydrodipicolinate synthase family protein [Pirellulales bacterium]
MTPFGGLWPAMLTPLDAAGSPDAAGIERLVEWFVVQGLDGLYILGSTGQWPLLDLDQRRLVAERVVRAASGRIGVMVHVGAVATDDAVMLARHAAAVGADAVSCVAPIYYPAGPEATFEHYRRIGAAGDLPLFVYHLGTVNQVALDPREYVDRLLTVPNIAGMKITDRDLYQFGLIQAFGGDRLRLFSGADEVMCHAALAGAVGAIGTFYNVWGRACQRARGEFVAGSVETGRRFMLIFQQAIYQALKPPGVWSFLRAAVRLKSGIDVGMPRPPLGALDQPWPAAEVERLVEWVDGAVEA